MRRKVIKDFYIEDCLKRNKRLSHHPDQESQVTIFITLKLARKAHSFITNLKLKPNRDSTHIEI